MAKIARKAMHYPSDVAAEEWERITPLMPKPGPMGCPREVEFRAMINAVESGGAKLVHRSGGLFPLRAA